MKVQNSDPLKQTFDCGSELNRSNKEWQFLIRQAWLKGFLNRHIVVGSGHNNIMIYNIIFANCTVTDAGIALLKNLVIQKVLMPALSRRLLSTRQHTVIQSERHTPKGFTCSYHSSGALI